MQSLVCKQHSNAGRMGVLLFEFCWDFLGGKSAC